MATWNKKDQTVVGDQYAPGMEDGFNTFTSATVNSNPIPVSLQEVALYYVVKSGGPPATSWTCTVPYVTIAGFPAYILPTDYIFTSGGGPKQKLSKTDFEAEYELAV